MFSMKQTCKEVGLNYQTLKFYCNQGLVPNVKRDLNNYRVFDEEDIKWIKTLTCLKKCGMSLAEMKEYLRLCKVGDETILQRKEILNKKEKELLSQIDLLNESIEFIHYKQNFYDKLLDKEANK